MPKIKFTWLQFAAHIASWLPFLWLLHDLFTGHLTVNPIQAATQRTGRIALYLLLLSLACTPVYTLFGFRLVLNLRRPLGLYAFLYAMIHLMIFVGVDYGFVWTDLQSAIFEKRFVIVGLVALVILLLLAITSYQWWMRRLGKSWKRLHRFAYIAAALAVLHFAWARKGDFFRLHGDIRQPLAFGLLLLFLLFLRLPFVRKQIVGGRNRLKQIWYSSPRQWRPILKRQP